MIKIGEVQALIIDRKTDFGAYLISEEDSIEKNSRESVLIPKKELANSDAIKSKIDVFVYRDSRDRLIATKRTPKITLGNCACLRVADVTKIGAFLEWGLEKDLLLPYHEQVGKVHKGKKYLVYLYIDKSNRLCATMKVYNILQSATPYKVGDWVEGYVYQINPELGGFVAVDLKYHGMILKNELMDIRVGESIKARINEVKNDGKLVLSPNKQSYKQIPEDAKHILSALKDNNGKLPYNDYSNPKDIMKIFKISKGSFKRAVGKLLREKKIKTTDEGIELIKK